MSRQGFLGKSALIILIVALIGVLMSVFEGCARKEPIKIGYAAQLTGIQSNIGVQARNGVQLAVEEINDSGGIDGRQIDLLVRDDKGKPDEAQIVDKELIKAGVVAIIGHATSGQTKAVIPIINDAHIVLISPTSSAPDLTDKSKYFFRVTIPHDVRAAAFAQLIYQHRHIKKIAVIYDTDNAAYSQSYQERFTSKFRELGGTVSKVTPFSSKEEPNFDPMLKDLRSTGVQGLLIIASDFDTALIAQRTRLIGWNIPLFSSGWAQTETLIKSGGRAVEGIEIEQSYNLDSKSKAYSDFRKNYQKRFGQEPNYAAALGYEAAEVLIAALKKTGGKPDGLREELLKTSNFKGLVDTFSFNKYGDAVRPFYVGVIRNGKIVTIDEIKPGSNRKP